MWLQLPLTSVLQRSSACRGKVRVLRCGRATCPGSSEDTCAACGGREARGHPGRLCLLATQSHHINPHRDQGVATDTLK